MAKPSILDGVSIRNFKIIRSKSSFELGASSYFVGQNNVGKSTILKALRYFFDDSMFANDGDFLNRTERISKQSGSSKSEISVSFNVDNVTGKVLRDALKKKYGSLVSITKEAALSATGHVSVTTKAKGSNGTETHVTDNDDDIKKLLNSISINYLHPQQGDELLELAKQKLKRRLLDNWGRRDPSITQEIRKIEGQWKEFREATNQYLSSTLNENTQKMWPESDITVGLPDNIRDILDISQITFSSYKGGPSIDLSSQGAGAQSLILYFTHYMLDSDKTMNRAREHHPIWLIEEPESFLHHDLIAKLGDELNSDAWKKNIQLLISTHSSILLSKSRLSGADSTWHLLKTDQQPVGRNSDKWTMEQVDEIGRTLGDPNFRMYFEAAIPEDQLFLEDSKPETIDAFKKIGLNVSGAIGGASDIKNMVSALKNLYPDGHSPSRITFLVDNDKGRRQLDHLIGPEVLGTAGFELHGVVDLENVYFLLTPLDTASEDLYEELDEVLDISLNELIDNDMHLLPNPPAYLSKATVSFRNKMPTNRDEAKLTLKSNDDFKAFFWKYVKDNGLTISRVNVKSLKDLIETAPNQTKNTT